jgi:hypothetical protein
MRPANQTEAQKAAWNEETRLLRNARAREARLRKKLAASAVPAISSAIPTPLTLSIPPSNLAAASSDFSDVSSASYIFSGLSTASSSNLFRRRGNTKGYEKVSEAQKS